MVLKKFPNRLLGEILVEEGFLDPARLKKALGIQKKQGGLLGEILVNEGWVKEEELLTGLAKQLALPFIRLASYNLNCSALRNISKEAAIQFLMLPFEWDGRILSIAMSNPLDREAILEIEKQVQTSVQIFLATPSEIRQAIKESYKDVSTGPCEVQ